MGLYTPIPDCIFDENDDFRLFEKIYFHIFQTNFGGTVVTNEDLKNSGFPPSAVTAFILWEFLNEVASSGLIDCLLNYFEKDVQISDAHEALDTAGEDELKNTLEAALSLLVESNEEGLIPFSSSDWCRKFVKTQSWKNLEQIQEASFKLADTSIFYRAGNYLRKNRPELQNAAISHSDIT